MNTASPWFVIYAFVFRMYYSLSLIKILLSFAWIYGKIRKARQSLPGPNAAKPLVRDNRG
jgi:hypothetical protein